MLTQPLPLALSLSLPLCPWRTCRHAHVSIPTRSSWLVRPLTPGQLSIAVRSVQHLPELWSALTWLLPRLAQYSSLARAQQCRSLQQQQQLQQLQQEAQQQYEQQQLQQQPVQQVPQQF